MKIRRFFESESNNFINIKDYFSSFSEDLDDICTTAFNIINDNYITITIFFKKDTSTEISNEEEIGKIDNWIEINKIDSEVLNELKSSIRALTDDDMLEDFKLTKQSYGYFIEVYTRIKESTSEWLYSENFELFYDKSRLKKIIKDKFGATIEASYMSEEYDKNNEMYLEFAISFAERIRADVANKIKEFILDTTVDDDTVFKDAWGIYPQQKDTKTLFFEISRMYSI